MARKQVGLPGELVDLVDAAAAKAGVSRTRFVEGAVRAWLADGGPVPEWKRGRVKVPTGTASAVATAIMSEEVENDRRVARQTVVPAEEEVLPALRVPSARTNVRPAFPKAAKRK